MIEEQVEREFFARHFQPILSPDECKADAELDEEFLDVFEQSQLKFALARGGVEREEVEDVRIFERLPGEIGLRSGKSERKIGDCFALALMKARLDLHSQNIARPAVFERRLRIPQTCGGVFDFFAAARCCVPRGARAAVPEVVARFSLRAGTEPYPPILSQLVTE
jgi:hypothetical protein